MSHRVWTTGRKIRGNVVPLLASIPFLALGIWQGYQLRNFLHWSVLIWFAIAVVATWIAIGFFGLVGNGSMRKALLRRISSDDDDPNAKKWFVGIATPKFQSLWDPHEDIGFLYLTGSTLHFRGDAKSIDLPRSVIRRIRRAPSIHSWLGLGGWVVVEGLMDGRAIQLRIEPREKSNLWGNRRLLSSLMEEIIAWHGASPK